MRRILLATTAAAALVAGSTLAMAQAGGGASTSGGANVQQHNSGGPNAGAQGNVGARGMTSGRGGQGKAHTLNHGIAREYSPFINPAIVTRLTQKYMSSIEGGESNVDVAMQRLTDEVNLELQHAVERDPARGRAFAAAAEKQKQIDEMKRDGKQVPLEMIDNPVRRKIVELERQTQSPQH